MNILVVGAHHDDIELGCGGTVARWSAEGHRVFGITLTNSETHFDKKEIYRSKEEAEREAGRAARIIGLETADIGFPLADNGTLVYDVDLMRALEGFIFDNRIEVVLSHWRYDMNTDHAAASALTTVAARHVPTLLQFRSNWYQPDRAFHGIYYVDISEYIDTKILSLEQYTVEINNRGRAWINSFIDHNRSWGFSIGRDYAEVFEPIRITI